MTRILDFEPEFVSMLPATYALLKAANLTIHPSVSRIILHGSRGLAGNYRPCSDIDLSLIVDTLPQTTQFDIELLLQLVFETTQSTWQVAIESDLAIIFGTRNCTLKCFAHTSWHEHICTIGGVDYFGLYKIQKGFNGPVTNAGIQVKLIYPCLQIWRRT